MIPAETQTTHQRRSNPLLSIGLVILVVGVLTTGAWVSAERLLLIPPDTQTTSDVPETDSRVASIDVPESAAPVATDDGGQSPAVEIMPATLRIPKLDVDADVEHVGYTDDGRMDSPTEWDDVAWFKYGFFPGAQGNAVIAGHLDSDTGPAIFSGLYLMEPGDEIYVTGEDGEELTFVVTEVESISADEAPLDRIFGSSETPQLNLITCEGHFDPDEEDYDHRLIVYTRIVQS